MTAFTEAAGLQTRERLAPPPTRRLYWFSVRLGLRSLSLPQKRAALARLFNPLSYPRGMEYALTLRGLELPGKGRLLDIGSPKLLFLWLASHTSLTIHATDIMDSFIEPTRGLLGRLGLSEELGERLHLERQDARDLAYPDGLFDAVYSVSVIEHIPENGDSTALREIARVLRTGGRACLTVPFAARGYSETWVRRDVFERRRRSGERIFFQRRYDHEALERRLVGPSGLRLESLSYFGEPRLPFDRFWNALSLPARLPLAWAQPLFERAMLRELPAERADRAIGVALTLVKG
jgi:SAM-dependent methyltransferase